MPSMHQKEIKPIKQKLESTNTFFNTQIQRQKCSKVTLLQENECGSRAILPCFIIAVDIKYGHNIKDLIEEALCVPIANRNHSPHLAKELAYQILMGTHETDLKEKVFSTKITNKPANALASSTSASLNIAHFPNPLTNIGQ